MRVLGGAVLIAASMLTLTACGSQATQPTRTATVTVAPPSTTSTPSTPSSSVDPTATATASAIDSPKPTSTTVADPGRPANQCTDIGVSVVASADGGGAGSEYYSVLFTNTGGTTCALRGTPGVSVVGGGNGKQLGKAADRTQTGVRTLTLQAGDTVAAPLKVVNIGTDGGPLEGCTVQKGDGYRVYPPHSTKSYFVSDADAVACASGPSFMSVGPVAVRTR
jgi:hypothetical protein